MVYLQVLWVLPPPAHHHPHSPTPSLLAYQAVCECLLLLLLLCTIVHSSLTVNYPSLSLPLFLSVYLSSSRFLLFIAAISEFSRAMWKCNKINQKQQQQLLKVQ